MRTKKMIFIVAPSYALAENCAYDHNLLRSKWTYANHIDCFRGWRLGVIAVWLHPTIFGTTHFLELMRFFKTYGVEYGPPPIELLRQVAYDHPNRR